LCALYAFMRWVDDISDAPGDAAAKAQGLELARQTVDRVSRGDTSGPVILPALGHTFSTYHIPWSYLEELIAGAHMDLDGSSYRSFDDLRLYCHRVAGIVGQCCVHVFGFGEARALELADRLGLAFQLTNILRDVAQDFALGRVYLPEEDLERFGCARDALATAPPSSAARELFRFEAERACGFYQEGAELLPLIQEDSRAALWALARIYSGLLRKMEARNYDVTSARASLSAAEKTWILLRARFGLWSVENGFETHSDPGRGPRRAVVGSDSR
jgi:phytoene synthase